LARNAGKTVRPVLQAVRPVLESSQTGLLSRLDRSVQRAYFGIHKHQPFDMNLTFSNHIAKCLICQNIISIIDMSRGMINDEFIKVRYRI